MFDLFHDIAVAAGNKFPAATGNVLRSDLPTYDHLMSET
jgi:hypothetical protein